MKQLLTYINEYKSVIFYKAPIAASEEHQDYQLSRIEFLEEQFNLLDTFLNRTDPELKLYKEKFEKFKELSGQIAGMNDLDLKKSIDDVKELVNTLRIANNTVILQNEKQTYLAKNEKIIDLPEIFSFWLKIFQKNQNLLELIETNNGHLRGLDITNSVGTAIKYFLDRVNID